MNPALFALLTSSRQQSAPAGGGGETEFLTVGTLGSLVESTTIDNEVGFKFVLSSTIQVTHLGRWVKFNDNTHGMRITDTSGNTISGTSITMDLNGATNDAWKWDALGSPVTLNAGTYFLFSNEPSSVNDYLYNDGTTVTFESVASSVHSAYMSGGTPTQSTANRAFVPVNFKYTT